MASLTINGNFFLTTSSKLHEIFDNAYIAFVYSSLQSWTSNCTGILSFIHSGRFWPPNNCFMWYIVFLCVFNCFYVMWNVFILFYLCTYFVRIDEIKLWYIYIYITKYHRYPLFYRCSIKSFYCKLPLQKWLNSSLTGCIYTLCD